jgi:hypothetical protein
MISTTRPASFMPPVGNSRPYWLKVRLPKREVQRAGRSPAGNSACFSTPRLLTSTRPWPMFQS